jgi:hypothetical protein
VDGYGGLAIEVGSVVNLKILRKHITNITFTSILDFMRSFMRRM